MSKLDEWMKANRYSDRLFAEAVSEGSPRPVTARAVYKWRHGETVPRLAAMNAIVRVTKGAVTANDFFEREPNATTD